MVCPTNCDGVVIAGMLGLTRLRGQSLPLAHKKQLLQLRVLRLGLLQDGDGGVGVFPESEEVFVGSERPHAGSIGIRSLRGSRLQGVGTSQPQMRQGPRPAVPDNPVVVENPRKLGGSRAALSGC